MASYPAARGCPKPTSSFGSVEWLSQSSHAAPSHTSMSADVSWESFAVPTTASSSWDTSLTTDLLELSSSEESALGLSAAGLGSEWASPALAAAHPSPGMSKDADNARRAPRRTFTAEQISTLESFFQHRPYLGPLERWRLAREMRVSEMQIKTWFQNRRMKQKRQQQDSQLNVALPAVPHRPQAVCPQPSAQGSDLQLLCPWASLPGPSWGPPQVEHASAASAWALDGQPPLCCLPDPGSQEQMLNLALCALQETRDTF